MFQKDCVDFALVRAGSIPDEVGKMEGRLSTFNIRDNDFSGKSSKDERPRMKFQAVGRAVDAVITFILVFVLALEFLKVTGNTYSTFFSSGTQPAYGWPCL